MIPSPCIGLCRINEASGLCLGCARTRAEIAGWRSMDTEARQAVIHALHERRRVLGLTIYRLAWTPEDLQACVLATLRHGGGIWVSGIVGAVAVEVKGALLEARTARAAMRIDLGERVRALAFGGDETRPGIVVLALLREDVTATAEIVFTRVEADRAALRPEEVGAPLYDFGLGRMAGRFGIRVDDAALQTRLDAVCGQPWESVLASHGGAIVVASPPRVVCNPIGRIEVFTPIPPPGGRSSAGPHTHFLPDLLARGLDIKVELPLPDLYIPCAIHYPDPATAARSTARPGDHE